MIEEQDGGFLRLLPSMPRLLFRFGGAYLCLKRQASVGSRTFRKELIERGIPAEHADALTELFLAPSDIGPILGMLGTSKD